MYMYMYMPGQYMYIQVNLVHVLGAYTWAVLGVLCTGGVLPVGLVESFMRFPFTMSARLEVLCSGGAGGGGGAAGTVDPPARGGKCAEEWSKAFWGGCRWKWNKSVYTNIFIQYLVILACTCTFCTCIYIYRYMKRKNKQHNTTLKSAFLDKQVA